MITSEILDRLQTVFDDVFMEKVLVTPDLTAKEVDEWDSITHVSLVLAIEEAFNVRFRVGEVEATKNVGELAQVIEKRSGGR
jgi:acyl carrier protein